MTIDAALEALRGLGRAWIVWNAETGEILAVTAVPEDAGPRERMAGLRGLSAFPVPTRARLVDSGAATRAFLEREREETARFGARARALEAWARAPAEEVLALLERGDYTPPLRRETDALIFLEHLWELHRELLAAELPRLRALAGSGALDAGAASALDACLLALEGKEAELAAAWRRERRGGAGESLLADCLAHVRCRDPEVPAELRAIVTRPGMFGPRREAMLALGRIGRPDPEAAAAVRAAIHDSSPAVTAQRERVLALLEREGEEPPARCPRCCHGRVHAAAGHGADWCSACGGTGWLAESGEDAG